MNPVNKENFYEKLEQREIKDILSDEKHRCRELDDMGYTYFDYVLFKTKQSKRPLQRIIDDINAILLKGKHIQFYN